MAKTQDTPTPTQDLTDTKSSFRLDKGAVFSNGRYKILDFIGQGGMGQVYKAHDSILERTVALKLLTLSRVEGPVARRFQLEAKATSTLKNEGIVEIYDFGVNEDGFPFMVMEYIEGETLSDHLKNVFALSQIEALALAKQICEAMQHAHEHEIVHRDLKPANIILADDKSQNEGEIKIKILDFGISKLLFEGEDEKQYLTQTGQIIGSPRYLSPEQALDGMIDHRTDIYSIGCIIFELLTGSTPFEGETTIDIIHGHLEEEPPKLNDGAEDEFPEELEVLVAKCLMKSPAHRYQSVRDLLNEIESIGETLLKNEEQSEENKSNATGVFPKVGPNKFVLFSIPLILLLVASVLTIRFLENQNSSQSARDESQDTQKTSAFNEKLFEKASPYLTKPKVEIGKPGNFYLFKGFNSLSAEDLKGIDMNKVKAIQIKSCDRLEKSFITEASMYPVKKLELVITKLDQDVINEIPRIKTLNKLLFKTSDIRPEDLDLFKNQKLITFALENNKSITGSSLKKIVRYWPFLEHLDLGGTSIRGSDLKELKALKRLNSLDLQNLNLTNSDIAHIKDLPRLRELELAGNDKLTIDSLKMLNHKSIVVKIRGCQGIDQLELEKFKRKNPNMKIQGFTHGLF